jgi:hypothetical protein
MMFYEIQYTESEFNPLYGKRMTPIHIYDRSLSSKHPVAICYDIKVAEMIVYNCNNK